MEESVDAVLAALRALPLRRWRATLTIRHPVALASPACAVVRGLVGDHVRARRCLTGAPRCDGCGEAAGCDFAALLGAPEAGVPGEEPRPFWWRGVPSRQTLEAGERFDVTCLTVADALPAEAGLDDAFTSALMRLGTGPARPHNVVVVGEEVLAWGEPDGGRRVRLVAETPLQLRGDLARSRDNCPALPWLALLVSAGIRRVAALVERYGSAEVPRVRMPRLDGLRVLADGLEATRLSRFAVRQGKRVPIEGWTGAVTVEGDAVVGLWGLLRALEVTGVGKGTSLGLGALRVDEAVE